MTLRSMVGEHECDEDSKVDTDICTECGEHAGFCSQCGLSGCCGVGTIDTDYTIERD